MNSGGMNGRIALVTGAAQGIGSAVAHTLAARGAQVAAVDVNADGLGSLVADLTAAGHRATAHPGDVRRSEDMERIVTRVESTLGPIDLLVNVAGILRMGAVVDLTDADWAAVFDVNTAGVFHASRAVARRMIPRGSGCIVTVASNAAGVPRMHMAAYAASKAASVMFTKCLGLELAEHGIRCNVVSPGSTDTPMQRGMAGADHSVEGSPEDYRVGIPLGKLAQPADVAEAVAFLASEDASHITMHDLYVDGGAALRA